ncbi:ABC transporter substrate-binding protein [bacterium]|nr:ABC transporter substrate-binding protein [bacterium]
MKRTVIILIAALLIAGCGSRDVPVLKVGYVGHDHQSALYIAALRPEATNADAGVCLKEIEPRKQYELVKKGRKIADVELYEAGGGSKMPTMMSQGHFEIGFGGVAAVAFFTDKGSPMKIISPLHTKGDMLVVAPATPALDWNEFVAWVKRERRPVRIGFKNPVAVAKLIFERALQEEGLTFTGDRADRTSDILMVHMKGEANLIPGLQNRIIDGYVSNNPWCAIAEEKGAGRIIADLNDLPPGIWKDHPCCCVAATDSVMRKQPGLVKEFLKLIIVATNYLNEDETLAARNASDWIGTTLTVEQASLPTSGFSTNPNDHWKKAMMVWIGEMNAMGQLQDRLKDKSAAEIEALLYDFGPLEKAAFELKKAGMEVWY